MNTRRAPDPRSGVLSLVGNTPIVEISRLDTGPCRLFVKLESQNPGGSIKDRIALSMVEAAERDGRLTPGATIIEATAGNTGLGLALVSAQKGYRLVLIVPDKMAREKVLHLKALGAEVRITRSDVPKGHPEYYQDLAERLAAEIPGSFYVNQFGNPANPHAHETTTGPEIWEQMGHDVDAVVAGVGSGGTITGVGRFLKSVNPNTEMVLADPEGSVLAHYIATGELVEAGSWKVEGIGEDFVPPIANLDLVSKAYTVSDAESFETARDLLVKEGILAGSSSGTLVAAALRYCREQTTPKRVVTFICDSGNKYLSKMFNDFWLLDEGFTPRAHTGAVRDLVTRRFDSGGTITVSPADTLRTAFSRMRVADVSQLPVTDGGKLVGLLDESDILHAVVSGSFDRPVREAMVRDLVTTPADAPIAALNPLFAQDRVAIVVEGDRFLGLVTRVDLINHLRLESA
ncbi:cystathionine beta-synthase [Azospirillum canadense]|uniref:cystathionine beta-synthase n=1 Tax=Azospirillum canadense TaxID=403962 RepID=UPI0022278AF4|nr:cystathionine beta-synthase [Azospirillum canadense]MCW2241249.1 cystathionine beta-synthase [Azospirillum canadense]